MLLRSHKRALAVLIVAVALMSPGQSIVCQTNEANGTSSGESAPGVSFKIRIKDGNTKFRLGELITIEMLFSSTLPDVYQVNGMTYDRSGRLHADTYHIDPEVGVVDPTSEYFNSALFGFMGGGLSPMPPPLGEKPYVIAQDLNEFIRFDRPGHYVLFVTNKRTGKVSFRGRTKIVESIPATSNSIELEILPADPTWQKQKVQEAAAVLDGAKSQDPRAACRTLRFLNSEAAETEMIHRYRGSTNGCDGDFHFGLIGSPRRDSIIHEMEEQIDAPDHPVTTSFIHTLSVLTYFSEYAPLPPYPAADQEMIKAWQAELKKRREALQEIVARHMRQVAATVSRKEKTARGITLATLFEFEAGLPAEKRTSEANAMVGQVVGLLPDLFLDLPTDRQYSLLSSYLWTRIANAAMLPVLRQIIEKPSEMRGSATDLRSIALKRLYELAPEEGRRVIMRELQQSPLRVRSDVLTLLPETTLPELDDILNARITGRNPANDFGVVADYGRLIARYASSSPLPRIKAASADKIGRMACDPQSSLLAYFLRVDPDYGVTAFEQALAARKDTGCYRLEFDGVGRLFMSPRLEEIAVDHLNDPDRTVAGQAVTLLGARGSAAAEKPLWNRLEQWHTQWQGRDEEVRPQIENGLVAGEPAQFEVELVRALIRADAWIADIDKLKRIEQLCLTSAGRGEIQSVLREWSSPSIRVSVDSVDDTPQSFSVCQYNLESFSKLKEKLGQFPKGTSFTWKSAATDPRSTEPLFQELTRFLAERGMTLEKPDK